MSSDAPESEHHYVSDLLYRAIFSVWARIMVCDTAWRAVDKNIVEAVVSDCALFIVAICVLHLVLRLLFRTLVGVLASVKLGGNTEYVLIGFTVLLLLTIYSNTVSLSEL